MFNLIFILDARIYKGKNRGQDISKEIVCTLHMLCSAMVPENRLLQQTKFALIQVSRGRELGMDPNFQLVHRQHSEMYSFRVSSLT